MRGAPAGSLATASMLTVDVVGRTKTAPAAAAPRAVARSPSG
jgi:hypothetical protein